MKSGIERYAVEVKESECEYFVIGKRGEPFKELVKLERIVKDLNLMEDIKNKKRYEAKRDMWPIKKEIYKRIECLAEIKFVQQKIMKV